MDGYLWRKGVSHPVIRPLLRNEIFAAALCLLAGSIAYVKTALIFWFGCGLSCYLWIFWNWTKLFLTNPPGDYSRAFSRVIILRFALRLFLWGLLLYVTVALLHASSMAILAGIITGTVLALASYALNMSRSG